MEKERKIKVLSLATLIIAVLGLTVAFAALSQTLTINGAANVDAATWDIHFENLSDPVIKGDASVIKAPSISKNSTYIGDFEFSLTKPGDSVTYTVNVVNKGTIDAKPAENFLVVNDMIPDDSNGEELNESYIIEADWDGDGITTKEEREKAMDNIAFYASSGLISSEGSKDLVAGASAPFEFEFVYISNSTEIPKGTVKLKMNLKLNFVQK